MSAIEILTTVVEVLLPPSGLALLAFLATVGWRGGRGRRRGGVVLPLLLGALVALAMPAVADSLLASLDPREDTDPAEPPPGAVVILSAELARKGDTGGYEIGAMTLERERAGAALARRTGLPVLVTGGRVGDWPAIAPIMRDSMRDDFAVPARWTEDGSRTTWENARLSAPLLRADGIDRVYLVTHAWHMRRSLVAFRRAGIAAVAAPVREDPWPRLHVQSFLPRTSAWERSYLAMHEWVGLLWYTLRP